MASISKSQGMWRVRIRHKETPQLSRVFVRKGDATQWATQTERALQLGLLSPDHDCTLAELLHRYAVEITPKKRSFGREESRINKLCEYEIGNIRFSNLTSNDMAKFRDERLKTVSGTTVVKDLVLISHAIKTAQREWGFKLPSNPVDNVNKPSVNKPRDRRLEEGEEERLLQACKQSSNHWFHPIVQVAIETGMRRGELLSLTWDNVHFDKNWVHLPMTKNGGSRDVPLSQKAKDILSSLPRNISGKVFPIHFEGLKSLWRRAMKRADIVDLRFHDLRHEATSRFFELGLNVIEVAAITGHKDLKMLQRYTHLRAEDLARKLQ